MARVILVRFGFSRPALSLLVTMMLGGILPAFALAQENEADQQAAREFNIIATAYNNGVYAKAAPKWEEFIRKYPDFKRIDEAHFYLGNSQLNLKKFPEAIATYKSLAEKYPKFDNLDAARFNAAMAQFQIAAQSNKPEDFQSAAGAFEEVIEKHNNSPYLARAFYYLGDARYAAGKTEEAAQAYQQLVDRFGESSLAPDALYYLGVAQQDLGDLEKAAATYERFLKEPANTKHELANEIRLRQGICWYGLKNFPEAEKRFAEVAQDKQSPFAAFALLRQGQCRMETGKSLEAAELFKNLLKDFPESPHALAAQLGAGKCFYEGEKYDDAKQSLSAVVSNQQAQPQQAAEGAYYLALVHLKQGKPDEALKTVEPAIGKYGSGELGPFLFSAKADALYDLPQRRVESAAAYQEVLKKFPEHPLSARALYMSAATSLEAEQFDTAGQLAQQFLVNAAFKEHPLRPHVLFVAAEALLFGGGQQDEDKRQQADALYRQLVAEHPEHERASRAHLRVGWCLLQADKHEEVIKYLSGNESAFAQPEQKAECKLMIGQSNMQLERFDDAIAALDQARSASSDWSKADEVLMESAQALRQLEKLGDARNRLSELLSKHPESALRPQATFQLGEIARSESNASEAIKRFTEVKDKFGDSEFADAALYALAAVHYGEGDFEKAQPVLDQLVSSADDDQLRARGLYLRGLVRQRRDQFAPAAEDLTAFLATNPEKEEALDAQFALALCHVGANKNADAVGVLQQLLSAAPEYPRADRVRYELGHALRAEDKFAEAASVFKELTAKHPQSPLVAEAWFHVGQNNEALAEEKQDAERLAALAEAAGAYASGLKSIQSNADVQDKALQEKLAYKLGDMQFQREQYSDAAVTLKKQLEEFPQGDLSGPARYLAGESHFQNGEFAAALPLFENVIQDKVDPYVDRSLYRAGECAGSVKNWPASQKHYGQLVEQFPEFPQLADARYGLAFDLQNQNKTDEAVKLYEQVAQESSGVSGAKSRFMLGEIAFAEKDYDDAVFQFGAVVSGYGFEHWQGLAQFEMARCLNAAGKQPQAIAALEKMLNDFSDHERAEDAQRLLAELQK